MLGILQSIADAIGTLLYFLSPLIQGLVNALGYISTCVPVIFQLSGFMPVVVTSCIMLTVAVGVIKIFLQVIVLSIWDGIKECVLVVVRGIVGLFTSIDLGGFTLFHFIVAVTIIALVISVFVRTGNT